MEINKFLNELDLSFTEEPIIEENTYTFLISDSDEYAKVYSILENSSLVDLEEDSVIITEHNNILKYYSDDFDIELQANFDSDTYKLIISEVE